MCDASRQLVKLLLMCWLGCFVYFLGAALRHVMLDGFGCCVEMIEVMFWHDACFYLASEEPMTIETAEKILAHHSIASKRNGSILLAEDVVWQDGSWTSTWIPCPMVKQDLLAWLGY